MQGIFDVKDNGAKGDGTANDAPAIQNAIIDAEEKGGIVWFPPGKYRLQSGLEITKQITIQGVGWNKTPGNGSWFFVDDIGFTPIFVKPTASGTIIRDVAIEHMQPSGSAGWTPLNYPYAFEIRADDCYLHNLQLFNPTSGIAISSPGAAVGRVTLDRIWGQPLLEGITIDDTMDVVKVNNIHFWPFWSTDDAVMSFVASNAEALRSFRNDNPHYSNVFVLGYKYGFRFGKSPISGGITSKFRITNADCDFCGVGIQIDGDQTTGQITNFTAQGKVGAPVGIEVGANNVNIQASNVRISDYAGNGIRVDGSGNNVYIENLWIQNWNTSSKGFPGVEVATGSNVFLGRGRRFDNGNGALEVGGAGGIHLDS